MALDSNALMVLSEKIRTLKVRRDEAAQAFLDACEELRPHVSPREFQTRTGLRGARAGKGETPPPAAAAETAAPAKPKTGK